ncbi:MULTISPECIES: hypothetical protein [unclassified Lentimonas]|uniref:hypothetical protein n=1 Tax=unclassified Lentimonas TaxID=2630993 RepID=UPI001327DF78|nr:MULTISPECIES: hypothetical protein [unclassified Lentimonas]CAA6692397.1 Unannotated [Lentimonas sp. CC19]CAA6693970.1 Unannotated [Lentimonas sp. CC10]CAA7072215.1 Unannotated [Lentimonas sp. CC11]
MLPCSRIPRLAAACVSVLLSLIISGCYGEAESGTPFETTVVRQAAGLVSIDLSPYTISKVRSAVDQGAPYIVASSYEGTLIGLTEGGRIGWVNSLSGFMNRDIWCADITGNGSDEILAANADGSLYCLDGSGATMWQFKPSDAPMNAVSVVTHEGLPYVVCGGYDKNIYYLNTKGDLVKTIASATYSKDKPWGKASKKRIPPGPAHIANFIRTVRAADGSEALLVHGNVYSNASIGTVYLFKPMADKPFKTIKKLTGSAGDLTTCDIDQDGVDELLYGASGMIDAAQIGWLNLKTDETRTLRPQDFRRQIDGFGYRVSQSVSFGSKATPQFFSSFGSRIFISQADLNSKTTEIINVGYSFNDIWKDSNTGKILLAGTQTGGSCIHIIDTTKNGWKDALANFQPTGKLKAVLDNTATAREQLKTFKRPAHERAKPVYMMSESLKGDVEQLATSLEAEYGTPVFLQSQHMSKVEDFDRSMIKDDKYRDRRDRRKKYVLTSEQALAQITALYDSPRKGISFWGGHGNDPYMFSTDTMKQVVDAANGEKSVFIYPELEQYGDGFDYVLEHHIYSMAQHFKGKNANIYVRTKHAFWQSIVYLPLWSNLLSGEYADIFVPSMEETTDKTMEQSVAARLGIWVSGATNQWGSRGARDNPSFDRLREHSHQMIPNHFLRAQIYNIASGSTYQNNFAVDQEYFSILYELIAKGALYVPERNEIVSFNPVHLSMTSPDKHYLDEGNNAKWTTFFDQEFEDANPMVFSRLNGSWPGAPVTEWDFSRYAAGVTDRRLNFLPPYENGIVLITPPQHGVFADKDAPRGAMVDNLHPIYKDILKEYITDGRNYLSANGKQSYAADTYYTTIEADIQAGAKKLPLTVTGDVAWVVAQTAPTHLRLTLIDNGYISPADRVATITFNTVAPVKMTNLLDGTAYDVSDKSTIEVDVPCGLFRFIDIELNKAL